MTVAELPVRGPFLVAADMLVGQVTSHGRPPVVSWGDISQDRCDDRLDPPSKNPGSAATRVILADSLA